MEDLILGGGRSVGGVGTRYEAQRDRSGFGWHRGRTSKLSASPWLDGCRSADVPRSPEQVAPVSQRLAFFVLEVLNGGAHRGQRDGAEDSDEEKRPDAAQEEKTCRGTSARTLFAVSLVRVTESGRAGSAKESFVSFAALRVVCEARHGSSLEKANTLEHAVGIAVERLQLLPPAVVDAGLRVDAFPEDGRERIGVPVAVLRHHCRAAVALGVALARSARQRRIQSIEASRTQAALLGHSRLAHVALSRRERDLQSDAWVALADDRQRVRDADAVGKGAVDHGDPFDGRIPQASRDGFGDERQRQIGVGDATGDRLVERILHNDAQLGGTGDVASVLFARNGQLLAACDGLQRSTVPDDGQLRGVGSCVGSLAVYPAKTLVVVDV